MKNRNRYDWNSIQADYDAGMSQPEVCKKYGCTLPSILKARRRGDFVSRTSAEGVRLWAKKTSYAGRSKSVEGEKSRREHLSKIAKQNNYGGYIKGSGRGKKGWYRGIWCDSSWELAYVLYCLDHGVDIQRNTEVRLYTFDGKVCKYIPDFKVGNSIVEIKGYVTPRSLAKATQHTDIEVFNKEEMKSILQYVVQKYGKKFIDLYDDKETLL